MRTEGAEEVAESASASRPSASLGKSHQNAKSKNDESTYLGGLRRGRRLVDHPPDLSQTMATKRYSTSSVIRKADSRCQMEKTKVVDA